MKLGKLEVGSGFAPFVIAEMSGNHNQSLERALALVDAAAEAGAHALKIQTYTADTMTLNIHGGLFTINDPSSLWNGRTLYDLYKEAYTPWEWHKPIFERAAEKGMVAFSTPFDFGSVDFLESLNAPFYKIASFENVDLPLIRKVASTGKPIIMSTGMADLHEISDAVKAARDGGCKDLVLLKCTSTYPAEALDSNLLAIPELKRNFRGCEVGLSDHTLGIGAAIAAVSLGGSVVEKHFTLDRSDGGVDSAFSLEPQELKLLVAETKRAWQSLGEAKIGPTPKELKSVVFRRSLYIVKDVKKGELLSSENLRSIRPGGGLEPKYFDILLGMRATKDAKVGTPVTWDLVK